MSEIIWKPRKEDIDKSNLANFISFVNKKHKIKLGFCDFLQLHDWSLTHADSFWSAVLEHSCIEYIGHPESAVLTTDPAAPYKSSWFQGVSLNFAQNLLRPALNPLLAGKKALVGYNEAGKYRELTYQQLKADSQKLAAWLVTNGFKPESRIAAVLPNIPEAVCSLLGVTAAGGIWSSASPDLGVTTLAERFKQIEPEILLVCDGYLFKEERVGLSDKISELIAQIGSIKKVVVIDYINEPLKISCERGIKIESYKNIISLPQAAQDIFCEMPFDHPLYILFSSGTTGSPKCIVHGAGRVLLEHYKELALHTNIKADDVFFYQTTTSWMMWNWLVSGLMLGSTIVLYDGSPLHKDSDILWSIAEKEAITVFGTNARYLALLQKNSYSAKSKFPLKNLKSLLSTGSPLAAESFDYIHRNIKAQIQISSISGGTDIVGCFALGCPNLPVYRGELQCKGLGMDIDVFDQGQQSVVDQQGELVCKNIFPTMPIYFWGDTNDERYKKAYWRNYNSTSKLYWHHGDFVTQTSRQTMIFHGRSDTTLNPGGVRIGTAEIYSILQCPELPEIEDSIAVAQNWEGDQRILLFLQLKPGTSLSEELKIRVKNLLYSKGSKYHVPKLIFSVDDIPKTHNNKISEQAVTDLVNQKEIKNKEALKNPGSLEMIKDILKTG